MLYYVNCNIEKICIIDLGIRQRLERRHTFSLKLNQFKLLSYSHNYTQFKKRRYEMDLLNY